MTYCISYYYSHCYTDARHTVISCLYYICSPHECICMYCFYLLVITLHMTCMIVPCYHIHVILLFPVTDIIIPGTGHESCWYAICGIPHLLFPFPVILFPLYCSRLSTELMSCYHVTRIMYCICSCYLVYLTHKDHLGMGETWRLIRSYRVDVWIHCSSHCRGRGSAGYHLLLMSIPLLF